MCKMYKCEDNGDLAAVAPNRIENVLREVSPVVVSVVTPEGDEMTITDISIDVRPNGIHILLVCPEAEMGCED